MLKACKQKRVKLTTREVLHWAKQLASGLGFLASKKYVHMDMAARNCLVGTGNVIKVADFGLTHHYDEGKTTYKQVGVYVN